MRKFFITCLEATQLIVRQEDKMLSLNSHIKLWIHLLLCKWCRLFKLQNAVINHHIPSIKTSETLTESEKSEIQKNLTKKM